MLLDTLEALDRLGRECRVDRMPRRIWRVFRFSTHRYWAQAKNAWVRTLVEDGDAQTLIEHERVECRGHLTAIRVRFTDAGWERFVRRDR